MLTVELPKVTLLFPTVTNPPAVPTVKVVEFAAGPPDAPTCKLVVIAAVAALTSPVMSASPPIVASPVVVTDATDTALVSLTEMCVVFVPATTM